MSHGWDKIMTAVDYAAKLCPSNPGPQVEIQSVSSEDNKSSWGNMLFRVGLKEFKL
jgi:hypothetical protein